LAGVSEASDERQGGCCRGGGERVEWGGCWASTWGGQLLHEDLHMHEAELELTVSRVPV
jgi:hypothetical protein